MKRERALFVDALRGIAALAVAWRHYYMEVRGGVNAPPAIPGVLHQIFSRGDLGVQVFFVISGFVIATSLLDDRVTPGFVGRFLLRRSLRLDPPYWAAIAFEIALLVAAGRFLHKPAHLPSAAQVGSHFVYLQAILGYGQIVGVFWTLCVEFQLYLTFAVLLGVSQRLQDRGWKREAAFAAVFTPVALASIAICSITGLPLKAWPWMFPDWHMFFAGVLVAWILAGRLKPGVLGVYVALALIGSIFAFNREAMFCTVLTASAIHFAGAKHALGKWLAGPVFQYLGKRSYSIYLVHMPIGDRFFTLVGPHMKWHGTWLMQLVPIVACVALTLIASEILYRLIEKPSLLLSQRIRLRPAAAELAPSAAA